MPTVRGPRKQNNAISEMDWKERSMLVMELTRALYPYYAYHGEACATLLSRILNGGWFTQEDEDSVVIKRLMGLPHEGPVRLSATAGKPVPGSAAKPDEELRAVLSNAGFAPDHAVWRVFIKPNFGG